MYQLYIFDKKCRLLLLDAIERLEVMLRSVIAHEMSRIDPLAYFNESYINPKRQKEYLTWKDNLTQKIQKSKDECITRYTKDNKPLPFWVIIEIWDFGTLSKYFAMLNAKHQNMICAKFNVNHRKTLASWFHEINIIRNHSAHHSRVWNRKYNPILLLDNDYFKQFNLSDDDRKRIFPRFLVIWYLISQYTHHYTWNKKVIALIENKFPKLPNAKLKSMGVDINTLGLFGYGNAKL